MKSSHLAFIGLMVDAFATLLDFAFRKSSTIFVLLVTHFSLIFLESVTIPSRSTSSTTSLPDLLYPSMTARYSGEYFQFTELNSPHLGLLIFAASSAPGR